MSQNIKPRHVRRIRQIWENPAREQIWQIFTRQETTLGSHVNKIIIQVITCHWQVVSIVILTEVTFSYLVKVHTQWPSSSTTLVHRTALIVWCIFLVSIQLIDLFLFMRFRKTLFCSKLSHITQILFQRSWVTFVKFLLQSFRIIFPKTLFCYTCSIWLCGRRVVWWPSVQRWNVTNFLRQTLNLNSNGHCLAVENWSNCELDIVFDFPCSRTKALGSLSTMCCSRIQQCVLSQYWSLSLCSLTHSCPLSSLCLCPRNHFDLNQTKDRFKITLIVHHIETAKFVKKDV